MRIVAIVFAIALLRRLLTLGYFLSKLNPDVNLYLYRSLARSLVAGDRAGMLLAGGPETNSRFRVPITAFIAVLAVSAFPGAAKR